ncbi:hypothetical protein [Proteiniborus sp.]|uniref:hypothetical protein n=1 Tax=Proteiniborus sp. TaxID=2079015 RepID=UPI00333349FF
MIETNIENFIVCGCSEEVHRYRSIYRQSDMLCYDKNQWTYLVEILVITIKSLIPCDSSYGSSIDYGRFAEELKLWYYYRHGENNCILGKLNNDENAYWEFEDDSVFSRIVPIIFANDDWTAGRNEVLKNILFTTGRASSILEGLATAKLLFALIGNPNINYDNLVKQIKEEIVCFSQKDFIRDFNRYFMFSPDIYKKNYNIDFERKRIELLNTLNGIDGCLEFNTLKHSLDIFEEPEKAHEGSFFFLGGIKGLKTNYEKKSIKDEDFIKNLCSFLVKLRKGRIAVESLQVEKYILPDIFQYKEGDVFFHTLLKKCQVIRKISNPDEIVSFIRTKSGIYRFWKTL